MYPIYWFSKKPNSADTSTFGSNFLDIKQCYEYIRGLRYRLRMMGIPVEDNNFIYCDNQSVVINVSLPDSTLKKKINSTAYHFFCDGSKNMSGGAEGLVQMITLQTW